VGRVLLVGVYSRVVAAWKRTIPSARGREDFLPGKEGESME